LTPFEFNLRVKAYAEKLQQEAEDLISHAYTVAYFHRVKRLPNLEEFLDKARDNIKKEQTPEDMLKKVIALNAQFGGKVVRGGEKH
jgi:hypothetical protein